MRILYITQKFYPETLAVERFRNQVQQLIKLGHQVSVLTTMPSYPHGRVFSEYRGRWLMRERMQDCDIIRVPSATAPNRGICLRAMSYLSFAFSAMLAGILLPKADLVIAAVPNPGAELAGLVVARVKGSKCLLEMVDLVPDNLPFIGISEHAWLYRALDVYYRNVYRSVDWIAVLCESAGRVLKSKGVDQSRILLLPNGADEDLLEESGASTIRASRRFGNKFLVVYAGSFSAYYEVPNLVRAACELEKLEPNIQFVLVGDGPDSEKVTELIRETGCTNVAQTGCVGRQELIGCLHAADLLVFSLVADPAPPPYREIISAKLCEYLYVGRPIVAVEYGGIAGGLLSRIGAGTSVRPRDPGALAAAILSYASDAELARVTGLAARSYAREHLARSRIVRDFVAQLQQRMELPC